MADAFPDRPARVRPVAAHGVSAVQQDGDLAVAQADEPGVEGDQRVAVKEPRTRGSDLETRVGDEAPQRAKSRRQRVRIGKVTDQEGDVDGT